MGTAKATALLACMAAAQVAYAQTCSGHSPPHTVALLELYTSEGCSSCPPADLALRSLKTGGWTERQVAPLSLHVDYWNSIGWRDPFSQPVFTERQRTLANRANTTLVYTPEFFVNGRELRSWPSALADAIKRSNAQPARADIGIVLDRRAAATTITVTGKAAAGSTLQVALHQHNLASVVTRGENGGRTLHHDYVARQWFKPASIDASGSGTVTQTLKVPEVRAAGDIGVTAFIEARDGSVLQAFSLPWCAPM